MKKIALLLLLVLANFPVKAQTYPSPVFTWSDLNVTETRWGTASCAGVPCPIGTGGDDSVPLNAISAFIQASNSAAIVRVPHGIQLNVCASAWTTPATAPFSMTIEGSGSGAGGIRILPGCATPPVTGPINIANVTYGTGINPQSKTSTRLAIHNLRVDAYCLAPHAITVGFNIGFVSKGSIYRNAIPSTAANSIDGGSNIIVLGGYQMDFDSSNEAENVDDLGHVCYGPYIPGSTASISKFPPYNVNTYATDSTFGLLAKGAQIANYVARQSGENKFIGSHGWGYYTPNGDFQAYSRPLYGYATRGYQTLMAPTSDVPVIAAVRAQPMPSPTGVDFATSVVSAGSGGTPNSFTTLTGTTGTGTKFKAVGYTNAAGALSSIPWVTVQGVYSVNPTNLAAEPVTATAGLTGVVLNINMGATGADLSGPHISGLYISGPLEASVMGVSIAAGVFASVITNNEFSTVTTPALCIVVDAGATLDSTNVITNNEGCVFASPIPVVIQTPGTAAIETALVLSNPSGSSFSQEYLKFMTGFILRSGLIGIQTAATTDGYMIALYGAAGVLQESFRWDVTGILAAAGKSISWTPGVLPVTPAEGQCAWESATHRLKCYDGTAWNSTFGITPITSSLTYDTYAQFIAAASFPTGVTYINVRAMSGTYPAASGRTSTPLTFKVVGAATGLFGEVTVAGIIFDPVYSRNPVNAGEFGAVGDANYAPVATYITASSVNSTTITTSSTAGLVVGMNIATVNYATVGITSILPNTTVVSFVPNTSILLSLAMPAGTNVPLIAWSTTVTGTDSTVALQATLNFALQNKLPDVVIPLGKYMISDTLHAGWGDTYYSIRITGGKAQNYAGTTTGTAIYATQTDRPGINFQGSRTSRLSGITLMGMNFIYAEYGQWFNNKLSSSKFDWLAPNLVPTGNNSGGLTVNTPYAGVTVGAYSGAQAVVHYPNRVFPAFTGLSGQYGGALDSDVTIEECEIDGFAVGVMIEPNSVNNGDYMRVRNNEFTANIYDFAAANSQGRGVEFRNNKANGAYTMYTGTDFGPGVGTLFGPIENNVAGGIYQLFAFSSMSYSGPLIINEQYCENCVRIGDFIAANPFNSTVTFNGGQISLTEFAHGQIPASYMKIGGYGGVTFNGMIINTSQRVANLVLGGGDIFINGGSWLSGSSTVANSSIARAMAYTGGMLGGDVRANATLGNRLHATGAVYSKAFIPAGTPYALQYGDDIKFQSGNGALNISPMTQFARKYTDSLGRQWSMNVPGDAQINMTSVANVGVAPSYVGDVMTFGYCAANQTAVDARSAVAAGDILYTSTTGTIFVVTGVTGPFANGNCANVYTVVTQQQNNMTVTTIVPLGNFVANTNPDPTLTGVTFIIKTNVDIPKTLFYGTFTSGSPNITLASTGNGTGTAFTTNYNTTTTYFGTQLPNMVYNPWPIPMGTTLTSVTNGSPGSAIMSLNALASGVFPIFPYELR